MFRGRDVRFWARRREERRLLRLSAVAAFAAHHAGSKTCAERDERAQSGEAQPKTDDYVDDPTRGWRIKTPHQFFRPFLIVAALVFFTGAPARAGEAGQPEPTLRLVAIYSGASAIDLASTEYALSTARAREGNPLMVSRPVRYAANAGFVALATWGTRELQRSGHPNRARLLKWGFVATRLALAIHNVRVARRTQ